MKLLRKLQYKDDKKYYKEVIERVVQLVQYWVTTKVITRVITIEGEEKKEKYIDANNWL